MTDSDLKEPVSNICNYCGHRQRPEEVLFGEFEVEKRIVSNVLTNEIETLQSKVDIRSLLDFDITRYKRFFCCRDCLLRFYTDAKMSGYEDNKWCKP